MYANFYHNDKCLYSIRVDTEHGAEHIADAEFNENAKITDWSYTDKPTSKKVLE
jgi:hypothetical protein